MILDSILVHNQFNQSVYQQAFVNLDQLDK